MLALDPQPETAIVNGRRYARPARPVVVICFDGCDPAYLAAAGAAGATPALDHLQRTGFDGRADAVMPTFTNPNNVAIVCGAPPAVTGVSGNYYLDRATGREVMVVDGHTMRADTILAGLAGIGVRVGLVTAKDKLLAALSRGLDGIALSAEAAEAAVAAIGPVGDWTAAPDRYSADLSLFVLDAGIALVERHGLELVYLSLSDFVQHAHAPEAPEAIAFMAAVDRRVGRLAETALVAIVADHGMNDMADADGRPRVVFVEDAIAARFGPGAARVICPITDPFVRHHASLGGFVRVHLAAGIDRDAVRTLVAGLEGVGLVLGREEACARFDLPPEPEGDLAVIAAPGHALGARAADHDLAALAGARLRSHGGLAERRVPFLLSRPLSPAYRARAAEGRLANFDIFDFALNGVDP